MKPLLVCLLSYAIVLAPGCRQRTESQSETKSTEQGLSEKEKQSVKKAESEIIRLLKQQKFSIFRDDGTFVSFEKFKANKDGFKKYYFVDNSNASTQQFMINMNMDSKYQAGNRYYSVRKGKEATHISLTTAVFQRTSDGTKGKFLSQATGYIKLDTNRDNFVMNFKTTMSSLVANLNEDMRGMADVKLNKVFRAIAWTIVALTVASLIVVVAIEIIGGYGINDMILLRGGAVMTIGGLVFLASKLVQGVIKVFDLNHSPESAFPSFKVN